MTKTSLGLILAAMCITVQPSFAQPVPGSSLTRFVVTAPVFGKVAPGTGIKSASFTVRAFTGQKEVQIPFAVLSSNGALAISFSDCSGAKPSVQFGTPVALVACLDTQKVVRGNYAFLLTVRYQKLQAGPITEPGAVAEPRDAAPVDCSAPSPATVPELHVAVNVAVSGLGGIATSLSSVDLSYNADPTMDFLRQAVTIDYTAPNAQMPSDAIDSLAIVPPTPPEGFWLSLSTDCQGMSLGVGSCTLNVVADPFKLIGVLAGRYTATVPISADSGGHSDLVINLDYSRIAASQLFPHLADGGEFSTEFLLVNPTSNPVCVDLKFHLDGNAPALPIIPNGLGTITPTGITGIGLPPSGSALFQTVGSPSTPLVSGWVEIVSPVRIDGLAKFIRHTPDPKISYQGSVRVTLPVTSFGVPFDTTQDSGTGQFFISGLAVANPDSAQSVQFTCTDNTNGATVAIGPAGGLPGFGHFPQVLSALSTPPHRGTLLCTATHAVGVLGLSFTGSGGFISVPII